MEKQNTNTKNSNISLSQVHPICEYSLYFDGCSKGNPGPSGIGAVIYKNGDEISASCENIGNRTNNESEYCALIIGLEEAIKLDITSLCVYGDSLLVINQANKIYKVKNEKLLVLYEKFRALKCKFKYITFTHIYRSHNKRADQLANMGLIKNIEQKEEEKDGEKDGEKDCMTFKTKRPIRANEEIFDAYINGSMPKAERQLALKTRYGFDCACNKCQSE